MKLGKVQNHLEEKLKDPYFRELYELEEQKLAIVKQIIDYRIRHKISQAQLAQKTKVIQQHISKIENGEFASFLTHEKVLLSIGLTVHVRAIPIRGKLRQIIPRKLAAAI